MTLDHTLANPLAVANDHVIGIASGCPLGCCQIIEAAPGFLNNIDLDAGLGFVHVANFL